MDYVWSCCWGHVCLIWLKFSDNVGIILFFHLVFPQKKNWEEPVHHKLLISGVWKLMTNPVQMQFSILFCTRLYMCDNSGPPGNTVVSMWVIVSQWEDICSEDEFLFLKFKYSEKATKFEKNLPHKIWCYSVTLNFNWKIFSNFVAFSEYPSFKKVRLLTCKSENVMS